MPSAKPPANEIAKLAADVEHLHRDIEQLYIKAGEKLRTTRLDIERLSNLYGELDRRVDYLESWRRAK